MSLRMLTPLVVAALGALVITLGAQAQSSTVPPIQAIKGVKPKPSVFRAAGRSQPLVIRSEKEAAEHFAHADVAALKKVVDFNRQIVLVFAWRGSGQDRLTYGVAESYPEQIFFTFRPGRTRDLRPHVRMYALRSNVTWRGPKGRRGPAGGRPPAPVAPPRKPKAAKAKESAEYIRVEVKGKLMTGMMAIGGETTGTAITANGITWELDLGREGDLLKQARSLSGKPAIVRGELTRRRGVEIRERWIVKVKSIAKPGEKPSGMPEPAAGTVTGAFIISDGIPSFEGYVLEIKLWQYNPLVADVSATLVGEHVVKGYRHTKGTETKTAFTLRPKDGVKNGMNYYVTAFVLDGGKRTHMGQRDGRPGLCKVLAQGQPTTVQLIARDLRR
ncbi:MAG: hypothetical protein AMK72_01970 [Planctomycetes bacterium SM23_25]|nr:MAG: hypothetical protein AMK72_01970 [Planctomycetes bacterium SM23_25]